MSDFTMIDTFNEKFRYSKNPIQKSEKGLEDDSVHNKTTV